MSESHELKLIGGLWLDIEEAAIYLRKLTKSGEPCVQAVRNLVCQGRIPFYKPYGRLLFKKAELDRIIESSRNRR